MRRLLATSIGLWLVPLIALASGDHEGGAFVHRVNTSKLSGANLLIANLYNDNRLAYAALVTFAMAALGVAIAFVVDIFLSAAGLKVSKVEHRE